MFVQFFYESEISMKICVFNTHIDFLKKIIYLVKLALFVNFGVKRAGNGAKKQKSFLMNASHNCISQLSPGHPNPVVKIVAPSVSS